MAAVVPPISSHHLLLAMHGRGDAHLHLYYLKHDDLSMMTASVSVVGARATSVRTTRHSQVRVLWTESTAAGGIAAFRAFLPLLPVHSVLSLSGMSYV